MWRRLNGLVTEEEANVTPCFICQSLYHSVNKQAHVDGWGVMGDVNHTVITQEKAAEYLSEYLRRWRT
jgi:hypothetical protein